MSATQIWNKLFPRSLKALKNTTHPSLQTTKSLAYLSFSLNQHTNTPLICRGYLHEASEIHTLSSNHSRISINLSYTSLHLQMCFVYPLFLVQISSPLITQKIKRFIQARKRVRRHYNFTFLNCCDSVDTELLFQITRKMSTGGHMKISKRIGNDVRKYSYINRGGSLEQAKSTRPW